MSKLIHKQTSRIPFEDQPFQLVTVAIYSVLGIALCKDAHFDSKNTGYSDYAGLIGVILLVFGTISSIIYNLFNSNKTKTKTTTTTTKTNYSIHLLNTLVVITGSLLYMVPMFAIMIDVIQNGCPSTSNSNTHHDQKIYNNDGIISENTSNSSDNTNNNTNNNNNNNNNNDNNISCFYLLYYISIMLFIPLRSFMIGLFILCKKFQFYFRKLYIFGCDFALPACFMIVFYTKWYIENNNTNNNDDFGDDSNWQIFECMMFGWCMLLLIPFVSYCTRSFVNKGWISLEYDLNNIVRIGIIVVWIIFVFAAGSAIFSGTVLGIVQGSFNDSNDNNDNDNNDNNNNDVDDIENKEKVLESVNNGIVFSITSLGISVFIECIIYCFVIGNKLTRQFKRIWNISSINSNNSSNHNNHNNNNVTLDSLRMQMGITNKFYGVYHDDDNNDNDDIEEIEDPLEASICRKGTGLSIGMRMSIDHSIGTGITDRNNGPVTPKQQYTRLSAVV